MIDLDTDVSLFMLPNILFLSWKNQNHFLCQVLDDLGEGRLCSDDLAFIISL